MSLENIHAIELESHSGIEGCTDYRLANKSQFVDESCAIDPQLSAPSTADTALVDYQRSLATNARDLHTRANAATRYSDDDPSWEEQPSVTASIGARIGIVRQSEDEDNEVHIPDQNLRRSINWILGKYESSPITEGEMATLTSLVDEGALGSIVDLTGLEFAINLRYLHFFYNNDHSISDLGPLSSLTNLWFLHLNNNLIADLEPLSGLTNLAHLDLANNLISDLGPLSGLTNLSWLHLSNNLISDLGPLSGLTNLSSLVLANNLISDLGPLSELTNLTGLHLSGNSISELTPLSGLTNLSSLYLSNNSIVDLGPIVDLQDLRDLVLDGNPLGDESMSVHLRALRSHGVDVSWTPAPGMEGGVHIVPLFPGADDVSGRQGFARIVNHSEAAGEVRITATDDIGRSSNSIALRIGANTVSHFNSNDLELGNSNKGLYGGTGTGEGDWWLELASDLDIEVLSYIRTEDGFLTAMHDVTPVFENLNQVVVFNPGSNEKQVSSLRLINPGDEDSQVTIRGVDDFGYSPGTDVRLSVAAGAAKNLTALELEQGLDDFEGSLNDGAGKWRLTVDSDQPLVVVSMLESPTGHLTNLSSSTRDEVPIVGDPGESTRMTTVSYFDLGQAAGDCDPSGIASASDRLYVLDGCSSPNQILAYGPEGDREPTFDFNLKVDDSVSGGITFAQSSSTSTGRFYVLEWYEERVYAYTSTGQRDAAFDFDLATTAAGGLTYLDDKLYVVDDFDRIQAYDLTGVRQRQYDVSLQGIPKGSCPEGITHAEGKFYIVVSDYCTADGWGERSEVLVYSISAEREENYEFALHPNNLNPTGITFLDGKFFVTDDYESKVYVYSGDMTTQATTHSGTDAGVQLVPLFPGADDISGRQGFARIINHSDAAGEVRITATDDAGGSSSSSTLRIGANSVVHFNSDELEAGNTDKGLYGGTGPGEGDWWLELVSDLDIEVLSYIRTEDGFLTAMHDVAPVSENRHRVVIFNPGSNDQQVSSLRLINPGHEDAQISIRGVDDNGFSPGSEVRLSVDAGAARTVTAAELERGLDDLQGALDDGTGKWRLIIDSNHAVVAVSLLESPTGHLTNLSTTPDQRDADLPASESETAAAVFDSRVSGPIVQSKCVSCHVAGGDAADTRLVFANSSNPDHEAFNRKVFEQFLVDVEDGAQLVLDKIQGIGHEGGVQITPGMQEFSDMDRFLRLLSEELSIVPEPEESKPSGLFALGPLADGDVTVIKLDDASTIVYETVTDQQGQFSVPDHVLTDAELLYLVEVSGGQDTDANDDGVEDGPHSNNGHLRAVLTHKQITEGAILSVISDIAWRYANVLSSVFAVPDNLDRLTDIARILVAGDLDGDGVVDYRDVAAFDPRNEQHRDALAFAFGLLTEPLEEDEVSALEAWLHGDETVLANTLDTIFGQQLSALEVPVRNRTVMLSLTPFGDGAVESSDGRLSHDPDNPIDSLQRVYEKGSDQVSFFAYPRSGSEVLAWHGCNTVTTDLQSCTVSLDQDNSVEVVFGYETPQIVDNFVDLTQSSSSIDENGKMIFELLNSDDEIKRRLESLQGGDFIVASANDGVLRRVDSVLRIDTSRYALQTSAANLAEVIKQGTVQFSKSLTEGDLADAASGTTVITPKIGTVSGIASELAFSSAYDGVSLQLSGDPTSKRFVIDVGPNSRATNPKPKIRVEDTVTITDDTGNKLQLQGRVVAEIDIDWNASWGGFDGPEYLRMVPEVRLEEDFQAQFEESWEAGDKSILIGKLKFKGFWVNVGPVPIKLVPEVEIYLGASGKIETSLTTGVNLQRSMRAGFVYDRKASIRSIHSFHQDNTFTPPESKISGQAKMWVEPAASVLVYGNVGPRATLRAYIRLNASVLARSGGDNQTDACAGWGAWLGLISRLELRIDGVDSDTVLGRFISELIEEHLEADLFEREWALGKSTTTNTGCSPGRLGSGRINELVGELVVDLYGDLSEFARMKAYEFISELMSDFVDAGSDLDDELFNELIFDFLNVWRTGGDLFPVRREDMLPLERYAWVSTHIREVAHSENEYYEIYFSFHNESAFEIQFYYDVWEVDETVEEPDIKNGAWDFYDYVPSAPYSVLENDPFEIPKEWGNPDEEDVSMTRWCGIGHRAEDLEASIMLSRILALHLDHEDRGRVCERSINLVQ